MVQPMVQPLLLLTFVASITVSDAKKEVEIIFKLRPGMKSSLANTVANVSGLSAPKRIFRHGGKYESRHIKFGLDRWYVAETKGLSDRVLNALQAQANVVEHQGIRPLHRKISENAAPTFNPDDPLYSDQTYYSAVGMDTAWAMTTGDASVVVAVVDSGIDMTHEDLRTNQWINIGEVCGNGLDDDGNGYIDDCRGYNFGDNTGTDLEGDDDHGTHCAGIVAADSDNGVGVAGTAGGKIGSPGA